MSDTDYTEIVLLCEDRQQELFARYFIQTYYGLHPRRLTVRAFGRGSGEQHVREQFAREVRAYRRNRARKQAALIVMLDGDTDSARREILLDTLKTHNLDPLQIDERVVIVIPRRNIEAWIHFLGGETIDEQQTYAKLASPAACKPNVIQLARDCLAQKPLADPAPESMKLACQELRRIPRKS